MTKGLRLPFFYDFKSPFSYLAKDAVLQLPKRYNVRVQCLPLDFSRIQPSVFRPDLRDEVTWRKIQYMYKDCRRFANERNPPLIIKGPKKLFDSSPANIGGLYCQTKSDAMFEAYMDFVFERFFQRQLSIDDDKVIAGVVDKIGKQCNVENASGEEYQEFFHGDGIEQLKDIEKLGDKMGVFGVPTIFIDDEMYFGNDRISFVEKHLEKLGLKREE